VSRSTPSWPPGALLRAASFDGLIEVGRDLRGFGGVHGGLGLALLTTAMQRQVTGALLRRVTARYLRPLGDIFGIEVSVERAGRVMTALAAHAVTDKGINIDATAIFAPPSQAPLPSVIPPAPAVPPPEECETFTLPAELVAISTSMQVRPADTNRPFAGGGKPALTAWIRLLEDNEPPDVHRLILLMDGLAPSYSAILQEPLPIPTVEFSVGPAAGLDHATSPWVLLRATTHQAGPDGWVHENIDAWGPDGTHLGTGRQLRLARPN
jgi:hypothetical protein